MKLAPGENGNGGVELGGVIVAPRELAKPFADRSAITAPGNPTLGEEFFGAGRLLALPHLEGHEMMYPLDVISPSPRNPRVFFNEKDMTDLINSIGSDVGQTMAVHLLPVLGSDGQVKLLIEEGHRRRLARERLGHTHIYAVVVRALTVLEVLERAATANLSRSPHTPIEEAHIYRQLGDLQIAQGHSSDWIDQVAKRMGKSPERVKKYLGLLELPDEIQRRIAEVKASDVILDRLLKIYKDRGTAVALNFLNVAVERESNPDDEGVAKRGVTAGSLTKATVAVIAAQVEAGAKAVRTAMTEAEKGVPASHQVSNLDQRTPRQRINDSIKTDNEVESDAVLAVRAHTLLGQFIGSLSAPGRLANEVLRFDRRAMVHALRHRADHTRGKPVDGFIDTLVTLAGKLRDVYKEIGKEASAPEPLDIPAGAPKFSDYFEAIESHLVYPRNRAVLRVLAANSDTSNAPQFITAQEICDSVGNEDLTISADSVAGIMKTSVPADAASMQCVIQIEPVRRKSPSTGKLEKVSGYRLGWKPSARF